MRTSVSVTKGSNTRFTPPASATLHSPMRRLWAARCSATSEDEHAVSTARLGPCNPSAYETRPGGKQ